MGNSADCYIRMWVPLKVAIVHQLATVQFGTEIFVCVAILSGKQPDRAMHVRVKGLDAVFKKDVSRWIRAPKEIS
jgi:hypothetical protein